MHLLPKAIQETEPINAVSTIYPKRSNIYLHLCTTEAGGKSLFPVATEAVHDTVRIRDDFRVCRANVADMLPPSSRTPHYRQIIIDERTSAQTEGREELQNKTPDEDSRNICSLQALDIFKYRAKNNEQVVVVYPLFYL